MITNQGEFSISQPMELYGLSTDTKPTVKFKNTKIENGSSFLELDTGDLFLYDGENDQWIAQ